MCDLNDFKVVFLISKSSNSMSSCCEMTLQIIRVTFFLNTFIISKNCYWRGSCNGIIEFKFSVQGLEHARHWQWRRGLSARVHYVGARTRKMWVHFVYFCLYIIDINTIEGFSILMNLIYFASKKISSRVPYKVTLIILGS